MFWGSLKFDDSVLVLQGVSFISISGYQKAVVTVSGLQAKNAADFAFFKARLVDNSNTCAMLDEIIKESNSDGTSR